MHESIRRIRGAIGMGLTWAVGWSIGGLLVGVSSLLLPGLPWTLLFDVYDAPLPTLAVPGFVAGVLFSLVLGIAARRRRVDQLSLPRVAAWGALAGLLLSLLPATLGALGLADITGSDALGIWQMTAVIAVPLTLMSALSASASLALARLARKRQSPVIPA